MYANEILQVLREKLYKDADLHIV